MMALGAWRSLGRAARRAAALSAASPATRFRRAFSSLGSPPGDDDGANDGPSTDRKDPRVGGSGASTAAPSSRLEEAREVFARTRARSDVFEEYQAQDVFQPSPSRLVRLSNWVMFYQLNRPRETQVDLVEFLEGAKYAMEATMMTMYSREFAAFASSNTKSAAPAADDSSAVRRLRQSLEPVSLEAFTEFVSFSSAAGIRSELQKLEVHGAHVVGVSFTRVPTRPTTNSSGAVIAGVPMHERLAIQVLFDVTEHFKMTLPGDESSAINDEEVVVRHNKAVWQFASTVTTPDDVDWTIEPLDLATI